MKQITPEQLAFVDEASKIFEENVRRESHISEAGNLIALRYGVDRDCVMLYELGDGIANFVQQVDVRVPLTRKEVARFSYDMEAQLQANEHKGGWESSTDQYLSNQLEKNFRRLSSCASHDEYRRRCANIANFAMMLSDNDREEEKSGRNEN